MTVRQVSPTLGNSQVELFTMADSQIKPPPFTYPAVLAAAVLALSVSLFLLTSRKANEEAMSLAQEASSTATELSIHGVKIQKNPPQSKLDELGVATWPEWGSGPNKIPWTFKSTETMYFLEGKVVVLVDGHEESFEIGGGDLVVFPRGMKIVWDVVEAVKKRYSLLEEEEEEAQSS